MHLTQPRCRRRPVGGKNATSGYPCACAAAPPRPLPRPLPLPLPPLPHLFCLGAPPALAAAALPLPALHVPPRGCAGLPRVPRGCASLPLVMPMPRSPTGPGLAGATAATGACPDFGGVRPVPAPQEASLEPEHVSTLSTERCTPFRLSLLLHLSQSAEEPSSHLPELPDPSEPGFLLAVCSVPCERTALEPARSECPAVVSLSPPSSVSDLLSSGPSNRSTRIVQPATTCSLPAAKTFLTLVPFFMTSRPRPPGRTRCCPLESRDGFTIECATSTRDTSPYCE
mmetsp:Transcript_62685/g.161318  ORF Transcript_62685/g.161318 Transcript_62685/m.161318 type:complete len:284 (+) Transcript_62685:202-1053(+)